MCTLAIGFSVLSSIVSLRSYSSQLHKPHIPIRKVRKEIYTSEEIENRTFCQSLLIRLPETGKRHEHPRWVLICICSASAVLMTKCQNHGKIRAKVVRQRVEPPTACLVMSIIHLQLPV
ncbi:unnamed protein product [Calypogeia fissa]